MAFHPGLVARFRQTGRVDQTAVVGRELPERLVDQRIVEIGLDHPGLQVVRHDPADRSPEELERQDVALDPRLLVHRQHRPEEQQPAEHQHHDEPLNPTPAARHRILPAAQQAVVDLGLLTRRRGLPQDPDRPPGHLLVEVRHDEPAQRRLRHRQPPVVSEPLEDRGDRHVPIDQLLDVTPVHLDLRPRRLPTGPIHKPRPPALHQPAPHLHRQRRPARNDPRFDRRSRVLPDRLRIHPQRRAQLADPTPCMPMLEQLHNVDHSDRSPCHRSSSSSPDEEDAQRTRSRSEGPHPPGNSLTDNQGNP